MVKHCFLFCFLPFRLFLFNATSEKRGNCVNTGKSRAKLLAYGNRSIFNNENYFPFPRHPPSRQYSQSEQISLKILNKTLQLPRGMEIGDFETNFVKWKVFFSQNVKLLFFLVLYYDLKWCIMIQYRNLVNACMIFTQSAEYDPIFLLISIIFVHYRRRENMKAIFESLSSSFFNQRLQLLCFVKKPGGNVGTMNKVFYPKKYPIKERKHFLV